MPHIKRIGLAISIALTLAAVTAPAGTAGGWWENWPRFSYALDPASVAGVDANVAGPTSGGTDEGRDPYDRAYVDTSVWRPSSGTKVLAYMEGAGSATMYIGALNRTNHTTNGFAGSPNDPLSSFRVGPRGAADVVANFWTWPYSGPFAWLQWTPSGGVPLPSPQPNANANAFVWLGLPNFVDSAPWLGSYTIQNSQFGISPSAATYPDGRPATGFLNDPTRSDPRNAVLFDALGAKTVDGRLATPQYTARAGCDASRCQGHLFVSGVGYVGHVNFAKDIAAPFWLQEAKSAGTDLVAHGADGLWVDNYSGWNSLGCSGDGQIYNFDPVECAFGEWSVAKFRSFLAANPVPGVDASTFDVRAYLRSKGRSWNDPSWLADPVWLRYVAFKSQTAHDYEQSFYDAVKSKAASLSKDVMVAGNDIPLSSFGSIRGTEVDVPYFEYGPDSGFGIPVGLAPSGHTGPVYALATAFGKSPRAVSRYSLPRAEYGMLGHDESMVRYLIMEALANDTFLPTGNSDADLLVNDTAARWADDAIAAFGSRFGNRVRAGRVGVVFSTETQNSFLTPGGYNSFTKKVATEGATSGYTDNPAGYLGWAGALEELHIPYRAVPDFRLTSAQLSGLSVLILPNVRSIEPATVNNVLVPFMTGGGTIVVSGQDAGAVRTQTGLYAPNTSALLYDLATKSTYATSGKAVYVAKNPGLDYYMGRTNPSQRTGALNTISSMMSKLIAQGALKREVDLGGAFATAPNLVVTLHADAASHRYFYDLLNSNLSISGDHATVAPISGSGTLKILVPADVAFSKRRVKATFLDPDQPGNASSVTLTPAASYVTVPVSGLNIYKSVLIEPTR